MPLLWNHSGLSHTLVGSREGMKGYDSQMSLAPLAPADPKWSDMVGTGTSPRRTLFTNLRQGHVISGRECYSSLKTAYESSLALLKTKRTTMKRKVTMDFKTLHGNCVLSTVQNWMSLEPRYWMLKMKCPRSKPSRNLVLWSKTPKPAI